MMTGGIPETDSAYKSGAEQVVAESVKTACGEEKAKRAANSSFKDMLRVSRWFIPNNLPRQHWLSGAASYFNDMLPMLPPCLRELSSASGGCITSFCLMIL
jgi:hypothetical protein